MNGGVHHDPHIIDPDQDGNNIRIRAFQPEICVLKKPFQGETINTSVSMEIGDLCYEADRRAASHILFQEDLRRKAVRNL